MPKHPKTVELTSWKGLNNVLPPERTPADYLKQADDIDIDKSGGIRKRKGYSLKISGSFHSLWSEGNDCFAVKDGTLVRIRSDYSTTNLVTGIGADEKIAFEKYDGAVYFTSSGHKGVIEGDDVVSFGIDSPNPRPTLSVGTGILTKGTYQIALTYVTSDGRESGAGLAQVIDVPANSGITITGIPSSVDSRVTTVRIYCSTPNGEVLYLTEEIPHGTTSWTIKDVHGGMTPLKSFNVYGAPNGHIIRQAHGYMFIAQDNILWYSEPFTPEWWKPHSNFMIFEDRIRAVMPTEGGMWVAADQLYYLSGRNPANMNKKAVEPVKAVEGSDVKVVGAYIFIENTPIGYKWLITTDKGIFVCFNDGIALNMTEKNVAFPEADEGTAVFVQEDGINRYMALLKEKRDSENTAVGDLVTATIIRNGVEIP